MFKQIKKYFTLKNIQRQCKHLDSYLSSHGFGVYEIYCPNCEKTWTIKE